MKTDYIFKLLITVLLAIVGFLCQQTFTSIQNMKKELATIQTQLAKIEASQYVTKGELFEILKEYHK